MIYLDTHVVVWLYSGQVELFSSHRQRLIESHDLIISPMVTLELDLHEIGRITLSGAPIIEDLSERVGLRVCDLPFAQVIYGARQQRWTRDPFDRIIVGQAAATGRDLLTRDRSILQNYARAVWGDASPVG